MTISETNVLVDNSARMPCYIQWVSLTLYTVPPRADFPDTADTESTTVKTFPPEWKDETSAESEWGAKLKF
jgi:hypothetical protein